MPGLVNHARDPGVVITASGTYNDKTEPKHAADGSIATSWITQPTGERWIQFEWPKPITVGCLQFVNGWRDGRGEWNGLLYDFKVQYHDGEKWADLSSLDVGSSVNFGNTYHLFGLEWNERELVFYLDRKVIRRVPNHFCYSEAPIFLSLAIIKWDGPVLDTIDGTSMKVDWVRVYQPKGAR